MKTFLQPLLILFLTLLLTACDQTVGKQDTVTTDFETIHKVEGGRFMGGTLKTNSVSKVSSLFPASATEVYSQHVNSQLFEGLFKFNQKTLQVEPCLAESYSVNSTNTVYTFKIRKDVKFHDNSCFKNGKGRQVTASDFQNVFQHLCSNDSLNKSGYLIKDYIKGSEAFFNKETENLEGVRVIDEYTLELELNEPFSGIISILALTQTGVYPIEAIEKYKADIENNPVGSGPYQLESNTNQIVLVKNASYWKKDEFGNQLPYISKITIDFEESKTKELANFNAGDIDFVWGVPVEEIPNIMGSLDEAIQGKNREFNLQSINSLQVQYFGFNLTTDIFSNKKVRQALNYAINKDSLVNHILQGEGSAASKGIIPNMQNYQNEKLKGYSFNPSKAKQLLSSAGYPNGAGFPTIELPFNKNGQVNLLMAENLKAQLKTVLNIEVKLVETDPKKIINLREEGKLSFWRYGWIADYPDPSNFISQFHSKYIVEDQDISYNYARYSNKDFDMFLDKAMYEIDDVKRMEYYLKAEQLLLDDAVFIPMYYASEIRLVNPQLKNFPINKIEYRDYSVTYFTPKTKGKKVRVYDNL
jgi:oligopeptide transport system substrate-binding protein